MRIFIDIVIKEVKEEKYETNSKYYHGLDKRPARNGESHEMARRSGDSF